MKLRFNYREDVNIVGVVLAVLLLLVLYLAIGFGICVACTYLACMFFGFNWSMEFAAGVYFIMIMLGWFTCVGSNYCCSRSV